jgi:PAS domain S-box-containing protein
MGTFYKIVIAFFILFLPAQLFTNNNSTIRNKYNAAENFEAASKFAEAIPILKELLALDPDNENFNFQLAVSIIEGKNSEDPLPYLEKAAKNVTRYYRSNYKQRSAPPITLEYLAKEYHSNYRFADAIIAYNQYLNFIDKRDLETVNKTNKNIAYCKSGEELIKNPFKVEHQDFGPQFERNFRAHSPVLSPDESIYIFASSNSEISLAKGEKHSDDIYCTYFENGVWGEPQPLTNVNTSNDEAPVSISPDGTQLILYRNDNGDGNLYYSELLEGKVWSKPHKYPSTINTSAQETHATLSADGNILYFTSDRKGGFGGLDLYMSKKTGENDWSEAINLGNQINSEYNEESPHLQANSDIFYFSSDRPESLGGLDIFRCRLVNDSTTNEVKNLGFPINTAENDIFFKTSLDGSKGFFTSTCRSRNGNFNLQVVEFKDIKLFPNVVVKGLVIFAPKDTLKDMHVNLFNIESREIVDSGKTNKKNGYYSFRLNNQRKYFASFEYDGYVYFSKPFKIEKYFANLAYSNIIYLDPIMLTDSSFRQSLGDFQVYNQNLREGKITKKTIDSTKLLTDAEMTYPPPSSYDLISLVDKQQTEQVSRVENKLTTSKKVVKPIPVIEPIPEILPIVIAAPIIHKDTLPKHVAVIKKQVIKVSQDDRTIADSLLRLGIKYYGKEEFVVSIETLQKAQNLFEKLGDINDQITSLNYIAEAFYKMGRYDESLATHRQSLALIQSINNKTMEGDKFLRIGDLFAELNDKTNALNNYYKSLAIRREIKDKPGEIEVLERIANLNFVQKDYDLAISYLLKSKDASSKNDKDLASLYNKLGLAYQGKGDYDLAVSFFEKAIALSEKISDKKNKSIYINNEGNAFYDNNDLASAFEQYQKSLIIKKEINYQEGLAITLHNIGNVYYKQKSSKNAIGYYSQSNQIAQKISLTEIIIENHFGLMQVYKDQQKYDLALVHLKKYIELKAPYLVGLRTQISQQTNKYELNSNDISLLRKRIRKQELLSILENEKRMKEIQLLENQQKVQKLVKYSIVGTSFGIGVLLLLLLGRYRTKRNNYKILEQKNIEIMQKNDEILTQKGNLEELNGLLSKLSIVASETGNAVAIFDAFGNFEWINKGYSNLNGFKLEELNINQEHNFLNNIEDENGKKTLLEVLISNRPVTVDVQKTIKSGESIWVKISLTPIFKNELLYKIISIEFDINDLKNAEQEIKNQRDRIEYQRNEIEYQRDIAIGQKDEIEEKKEKLESTIKELQLTQKKLVESEKMASLGNLVAGISHEINTPVGIGIAAITTLKNKVQNIESLFVEKKMKQTDLITFISTAKDAARLIQTHLNRTGELVKSFKRISVDEMTEQLRTFDLNQYVADVIKSLEPKTNEKEVEVIVDFKGDFEMTSYPGAFAQIFTHLIVNTIFHGFKDKPGGKITIKGKRNNNLLILTYQDDGNGMIPEVVEKVFNPFFTTNMQAGNGLGMNIVYNVVTQKLKGDITCESIEGQGVTFKIECPISLIEEEKPRLRVVS